MGALRASLISLLALISPAARGAVSFEVVYDDPSNALAPYQAQLTSHALAAGARWAEFLTGDATITLQLASNPAIPYGNGSSVTTVLVENAGGFDLFEQGMAYETRTGIDPNGAAPDVRIELSPDYVAGELWFDPDPVLRSAPTDINRTDAMSVFLHEIGHALAYNGWLDSTTGQVPSNYRSPWDAQVTSVGGQLYFNGPEVVAYRGAPAPVTLGNATHWGNYFPLDGQDLELQLMNGLVFYRGYRYDLSRLDLALLADTGVGVSDWQGGDYNADGAVTESDHTTWATDYQRPRVSPADGNGDGVVDAADYTVWRDALSAGGMEVLEGTAVPEGTTAALAMAAFTLQAARRRGF
jgi:hypothetical protein